MLYSNVRSLRQASGELARAFQDFHPLIVCLSETYLCEDAPDSFCPPSYVVMARRDKSKHGYGILILIQEHNILFEEISTTDFSIAEKGELVAITINSLLFVCCYRQPSFADVTLITKLDRLLDRYPSTSPITYL